MPSVTVSCSKSRSEDNRIRRSPSARRITQHYHPAARQAAVKVARHSEWPIRLHVRGVGPALVRKPEGPRRQAGRERRWEPDSRAERRAVRVPVDKHCPSIPEERKTATTNVTSRPRKKGGHTVEAFRYATAFNQLRGGEQQRKRLILPL